VGGKKMLPFYIKKKKKDLSGFSEDDEQRPVLLGPLFKEGRK
jgi:hypothetical protein